jgi:hypothetical protein
MPLFQPVRLSWPTGRSIKNVSIFRELVCIQRQSQHGFAAAVGLLVTPSGQNHPRIHRQLDWYIAFQILPKGLQRTHPVTSDLQYRQHPWEGGIL